MELRVPVTNWSEFKKGLVTMARPKTVNPLITSAKIRLDGVDIPAGGTHVFSLTVKGLRVGHPVLFWTDNLDTGLVFFNPYCPEKDLLSVQVVNTTSQQKTVNANLYVVQI